MRQAQQKRNMTFIPGGVLKGFYDTIAKNNFSYIAFIVAGIVVTENIYGSAVDAVWASKNNGKTFDSIDWIRAQLRRRCAQLRAANQGEA
ncbi:hypothetical protein TrRE_jg10186 [Triparma retinervis]|uniref:Uncharacterized protein n=1 Tax=Triparma retinervis TaxID=2557542 RepID=A0A9W7A5S0_9STRA|nr:hypothetical protein TrRE_jg10186 [Triparma retinervis]